jgi:hypothetical protein
VLTNANGLAERRTVQLNPSAYHDRAVIRLIMTCEQPDDRLGGGRSSFNDVWC